MDTMTPYTLALAELAKWHALAEEIEADALAPQGVKEAARRMAADAQQIANWLREEPQTPKKED